MTIRRPLESETTHVGFVMVKPHAFDLCLDPLVSQILEGSGLASQLAADDKLRPVLDNLTLGNPVIRNLATVSYGSKFLELLYGDKSTRRYYPLIQEYYLGRIAILPYCYEGASANMPLVYAAIKGTTETYSPSGQLLEEPTGLRGLLGEPYEVYDNQSSLAMGEDTYRKLISPVVNNFIHVSDSEAEICAGLQLVYRPDEWVKTLRHLC